MTKLYLITGFLGAGKTTLLKKLIAELADQRIYIIVNEFGKEGIDGQLLLDLQAAVEEINNGSIFCTCCLEKFEDALFHACDQKADIILAEASGLSDPTGIRTIVCNKEKFGNIEFMGCICLIDACNFCKVYETATVVKKQIAVSNLAIINKTDLVQEDRIRKIRAMIGNQNPGTMIKQTSYGAVDKSWLAELEQSDWQNRKSGTHMLQQMDLTLKKMIIVVSDEFTCYEMEKFIHMFLEYTYRIKGFVRMEGRLYLLNCVSNKYQAELYHGKAENVNHIVVLSGNGMPVRKYVKEAVRWYEDKVITVE